MIFDRKHQFWQIVSKEYKKERTNKIEWNQNKEKRLV